MTHHAFNRIRLLSLASTLLLSSLCSFGADVEGAKDHPLISRYPGSEIVSYYEVDYNEVRVPERPAKENQPPTSFVTASGHHTAIVYRAPAGKSTAELMRNFRDAVVKAGKAQVILECKGGECDGTSSWYAAKFFNAIFNRDHKGGNGPNDHYFPLDAYNADQRYLAARLTTAEGRTAHVEIGMVSKADAPVHVSVEVIEADEVKSGQVNLNLESLNDKLATDGRVPFYGIHFDTGRASLRDESASELSLLLRFLATDPKRRLYVVGHTDDTGDLKLNLQLSLARAEAVVAYLKAQKIDPQRLTAHGAGPLAPVSTNRTEAGRQLNRRVEIVERIK